MKTFSVYILTNSKNSTLYIGFTNNLMRRISEHKSLKIIGFSKKYKLTKLVYYENYDEPIPAIAREKQLKGWLRKKKDELINSSNPNWNDLSIEWYN